jgi:hypothetical protein
MISPVPPRIMLAEGQEAVILMELLAQEEAEEVVQEEPQAVRPMAAPIRVEAEAAVTIKTLLEVLESSYFAIQIHILMLVQ